MVSLRLPAKAERELGRLAKRQHSSKAALAREAVYGLLADLKDSRDGAAVLARVEAGKEKTYTLEQVAAELDVTLEG
ncbi:MAG: ribbon-helix-helix protein, CopG family [Opitutus sp.]|jgi:predicted DNA-binding protein|nr:ribbon-helix-helix protein, CopG family [Opitutus sp.]MCS6246742.1 ribbon-helix-helix protein, CopG family [Opitutus sp.]MCS6273296.1 ribbon-helix-helix protein, CopG family [Opitutus sp.]MCS6276166.1 ribbon-helix-helix protein, CopG family [Opitutus sp.]MCS6301260.1 ribbon-helix-helix protein, CopG family [Opitutus sp.]